MTDQTTDVVLTLGDSVTFTWHLTRKYESVPQPAYGRKVWRTELWPGQPEPEPREGIVIGVRTLTNGINEYYGYDQPIQYRPKESVKAYLVAYDMRRKPVLVLPEHLRLRDNTPAATEEADRG